MINQNRISVIIPALRVTPSLKTLAHDLGQNDIFEIFIISPNAPLAIGGPHIKTLSAQAGRGPQIQAGLDAANGDIIWILHSDSQIPSQAVKKLRIIINKPRISFGCFRLGFTDNNNIWLTLFAWVSRFDSIVTTFGDQGFFFPSHLISRLPDLTPYPLMEDIIIRRALLIYGRTYKSSAVIKTSPARFNRYGPLRTQIKNGLILWAFWRGATPRKLYNDYYSHSPESIKRPVPNPSLLAKLAPKTQTD